jgi:hypothetical protein
VTTPWHPFTLLARSTAVLSRSLDETEHLLPTRETPCADWDLGTLIGHVSDSVRVLTESLAGSPAGASPRDCRQRARLEIGQLSIAVRRAELRGEDVELMALTGAYELTLHAWDISESTRVAMTPPADLVGALLTLAPRVLEDIDRAGLFGPSLPPLAEGSELERLLGLFGRRPRAAV